MCRERVIYLHQSSTIGTLVPLVAARKSDVAVVVVVDVIVAVHCSEVVLQDEDGPFASLDIVRPDFTSI